MGYLHQGVKERNSRPLELSYVFTTNQGGEVGDKKETRGTGLYIYNENVSRRSLGIPHLGRSRNASSSGCFAGCGCFWLLRADLPDLAGLLAVMVLSNYTGPTVLSYLVAA